MTNQIFVVGNLGKDPQKIEGKSIICKFSLAETVIYKGEKKTQWHNIIAFGKIAGTLSNNLTKGDKLLVSGTLQNQKYTDKEGNKRTNSEIIVRSFEFFSSKKVAHSDESQESTKDDLPF